MLDDGDGDALEIAGGNEASAFAPVVSSSAERPAETSEMHDPQQQRYSYANQHAKHTRLRDLKLLVLQMGAIVPCCLPRPDWRPRRCPPPMVKPLVASRRTLEPRTPPPDADVFREIAEQVKRTPRNEWKTCEGAAYHAAILAGKEALTKRQIYISSCH